LKQMQSWSKGIITAMSKWKKEKNTPSNGQCQASFTLENGLTVEYLSVCWMRRAEWGRKNRRNSDKTLITIVLFASRLYTDA
jgi:hypothetical protein